MHLKTKKIAPHGSSEAFIRAHINHAEKDKCLIWPYRLNDRGYGLAVINGDQKTASRWMCILAHGTPVNTKLHSAHNCGNPACVNPNHLRWATPRENSLDRFIHGTDNRGERNPKTTITDQDVLFIRSAPPNLDVLCEKFGLKKHTISKIRRSKTWKHIPPMNLEGLGEKDVNTHCRNGHLYDEANTYRTKTGYRQCRKCGAANARKKRSLAGA